MITYKLENYKKSKLIVISLWLIYGAAYFCRTCYSTSMAAIVSSGAFSKAQIGLVGSAFFVCYGFGQIINGFLGDRLNPFLMVLFGGGAGAICCLSMCYANNLALLAVIWGINGFCQSMLWSPILRIFSEVITSKLQKKAALNIALSLPVGTILSYAVSTVIIKFSSWHSIFIGGFAVLFCAVAFGIVSYTICKKDIVVSAKSTKEKIKTGSQKFLPIFVSSGLIIILIPAFLHGMLRDGITNWVPTMLNETYNVSASLSVFLTIALPVFNAFGAYAITPIYKKLGDNEAKAICVCGAFAIIPLTCLLAIGKINIAFGLLLLALTTSSMYALNYIIITRIPMRFAKYSRTSTVTGILNSFAYIGCAVSTYGFGALSEKAGWTATILLWLLSVIIIIITALTVLGKFKKQNIEQ